MPFWPAGGIAPATPGARHGLHHLAGAGSLLVPNRAQIETPARCSLGGLCWAIGTVLSKRLFALEACCA